MEKIIPNFIIGGPPKCASTSLNFYLKQHPEIFMSPEKETRFFSVDYSNGIEFYLKSYFAEATNEKVAGETTPTYFLLPFVAKRIKEFNPAMKMIFCFRNPVDRAYSGWSMRMNNGTEHLPFRQAIDANIKQRNEINFIGEAAADQWVADQKRTNRKDETGFRTYLEGSMYAYNLKCYYQYFDKSQIKIIFLDALKKDFNGTLRDIFTFLDVDPEFKVQDTEQKNTYKKSKFTFLEPILGKNKKFSKMLSNIMPKSFKKKMLNTMYVEGSKDRISPEDKKYVYEIFKDEIAELEKLLDIDLTHWKVA